MRDENNIYVSVWISSGLPDFDALINMLDDDGSVADNRRHPTYSASRRHPESIPPPTATEVRTRAGVDEERAESVDGLKFMFRVRQPRKHEPLPSRQEGGLENLQYKNY